MDALKGIDEDRIQATLMKENEHGLDHLAQKNIFIRDEMVAELLESFNNNHDDDYSFLDSSTVKVSNWGIDTFESVSFFNEENPTSVNWGSGISVI
jgi:hypothetical protein